MTKTELESKSLSELHALAAKAGVERYRMLSRGELIEKLAGGNGGGGSKQKQESRQRRPQGGRERQRRERQPQGGQRRQPDKGGQGGRKKAAPAGEERSAPPAREASPAPSEKPKRRRRRRFGRRGRKDVRITDMLLPAVPGRQALVYAETRAGCTALLRELAAELSGANGPDPVALLIDPSPEELAEWKREAPKAEIVSASQERHAGDALAQAARRAESGEAVVLLVDSLSRAAEEFGGTKAAKELFDGGQAGSAGVGSLTIVAAIERPA